MSERGAITGGSGALEALRATLPDAGLPQSGGPVEIAVPREKLVQAAEILKLHGYALAGLVVEWAEERWQCRYAFYDGADCGPVTLLLQGGQDEPIPSISHQFLSADWHEREVEDLFEIRFVDHPLLGDFVLHNEDWPEGVAPMRPTYSATSPKPAPSPREWRPQRFVDAPGAFSMSVGPVYSGVAESAQFRLESEGEQILHAMPRLFYKYRGLEKIAEGKDAQQVLLLAERMNGTAAFAHGLAFSQAAEAICGVTPPPRAQALRVCFAELERLRSHVATLEDLVESTGLMVPAATLAMSVEDLLRLGCVATGHRYLFGAIRLGGLAADLPDGAADVIRTGAAKAARELERVMRRLAFDNGFLDRVEEVGTVTVGEAERLGAVGPVARASGVHRDLRRALPYLSYDRIGVRPASAEEGDAYARARVLALEASESARLITDVLKALPPGPVLSPWHPKEGHALGWSEAPTGAGFHWLRLAEDGSVLRWRAMPPSFTNWPVLASAVEEFAFQDFPIILAGFGLSVAESDR